MIKPILGGLSIVVALFLGWAAARLFTACIQPWLKSPQTVHVTWIVGGIQLTGWQILVPFAALLIVAGILLWVGIWLLRVES